MSNKYVFGAKNATAKNASRKMEVILRSNNSLFQCAVNQIQSYDCFWVQLVTSVHSTFKLIFGGQKRFQIHNKTFRILNKIEFCSVS